MKNIEEKTKKFFGGQQVKKMVKEEILKTEEGNKIKRYCQFCGHSTHVPKFAEYRICTFCGNAVFYDEKAEFKYKLLRKINENNRTTVQRNIKK